MLIFFTSGSDHYKKLRRETLIKEINKITWQVAEDLPDKPNIISHSFIKSFITQLWRDTSDIEFVSQALGHAKINTTSL